MYSFSSTIAVEHKEELERILFLNMNQGRYQSTIIKHIELYGNPIIVEKDNQLRITLEHVDCQNLFVMKDERLVGAILFNRNTPTNIAVLHIAVDEKHSSHGIYAGEKLVLKMIYKLKGIILMIKGVKTISVQYEQEKTIDIHKI